MDLSLWSQSRFVNGRHPAALFGLSPGRRSGRVPALPYPPPKLVQCIRDHGYLAIPGWVARSQAGAEEFAWDRVPGPGGCTKIPAHGRIVAVVWVRRKAFLEYHVVVYWQ